MFKWIVSHCNPVHFLSGGRESSIHWCICTCWTPGRGGLLWDHQTLHLCIRSTVETSLSCKSWGKRLEHVALHNKGIALQTTRKIGTQLKPCRGLKICQCVSVCRSRRDMKRKVWFSPHCSCPNRGLSYFALIQSTSHKLQPILHSLCNRS